MTKAFLYIYIYLVKKSINYIKKYIIEYLYVQYLILYVCTKFFFSNNLIH